MTLKPFTVVLTTTIELDVDDSLTPDQEWRDMFYDYFNLKQVAGHIAYNVLQGFSFVEGVGPADDRNLFVVRSEETDVEYVDEGY